MGQKKASRAKQPDPKGITSDRLPTEDALVFISHDTRDGDLAEAFSNLLTDASGGILKSFRSSDRKGTAGIEFGAEWYNAIMSKLGCATDVVALLTPHSIDRPWILYEAGVAKGKLDTTVLGLAIGVPLEKAGTGPFAQFQNCADDENSLTKLVLQLITKNPKASPREAAVRLQVQAFRKNIESVMENRTKAGVKPASSKVDDSTVAKLFEEVKVLVGDLPSKLESRISRHPDKRSFRKIRRLHPVMFEDVLRHLGKRAGPNGTAVAWLMFVSFFKDDAPWLYELGLDVYHAIKSNNAKQLKLARIGLRNAIELFDHSPFGFELYGEEGHDLIRFAHHILRDFDRMFEESTMRLGMGKSSESDEKSE